LRGQLLTLTSPTSPIIKFSLSHQRNFVKSKERKLRHGGRREQIRDSKKITKPKLNDITNLTDQSLDSSLQVEHSQQFAFIYLPHHR
jgi:hypothetical protein